MTVTQADLFSLAARDLSQLVTAKGGRVGTMEICNALSQNTRRFDGKVLWFWPGTHDQWVTHAVTWQYRLDGHDLGYTHQVNMDTGRYFLVDNYQGEDAERWNAAYFAAFDEYRSRTY
jgi:hypothetical protein